MVIYNGRMRTVHYVQDGLSPSDAATVRDLERAENDVAMADMVQDLRLQYLRDERELEARRHQVQMLLYGYSSDTTAGLSGASPFGGLAATYGPYGVSGGFFYPGYGITGPYAAAYPYAGGGVLAAGFSAAAGSNSLAYGVGDEGVVKNVVAGTLSEPASPDFAARAHANLGAAWSRASQIAAFRSGAGLKGPIALAAGEESMESRFGLHRGDNVNVTVRGADKAISGKVVAESPGWITIDTDAGQETVRTSEITRVVKPKK